MQACSEQTTDACLELMLCLTSVIVPQQISSEMFDYFRSFTEPLHASGTFLKKTLCFF